MRTPEIRDVLARVRLFRAFNAEELEGLAALCTLLVLEKGATVCRAGEEGDRLFVVADGELEVWSADDRQLLNRLQAGEVVGEMALLLGAPRSATVIVARAARLLVIDKAAFDRFFLQNPKVLEHLARYLAQRLATIARGERVVRRTTTIAVTSAPGLRGKTLVASSLATILRAITGDAVVLVRVGAERGRTLLADLVAAPEERIAAAIARDRGPLVPSLGLRVRAADQDGLIDDLTRLVEVLGDRFVTIVFDTGGSGGLARAVEAVSDIVVEIADAPGAAVSEAHDFRRYRVLDLHNPATARIPVNQCAPFVLPVEEALAGLDADRQAAWVRDHRTAPISRVLHRLARKVLRMSVGVALGGGAAFGIAHIGVLQVLEDAGIPIDLIAGTSMGSIIGAGYASGIAPAQMGDIARRIGTWWTTLNVAFDPTLLRPAILSGEKMARVFANVAGAADAFEDLVVPYRAVAADIESGERVAIGTGSLALAYRASAAVPILWSPIRIGERVLVDGSIVDPVPCDVVRQMGADLCIAVNVVPPLKRGVQTVLARWYHLLSGLNPLARLGGNLGMPSMFDLGMNTLQMLQYELGNYKAIGADALINPDLSAFTWVEFYRAGELVDRGAAAAELALPHVRRVLAERLATRGYGGQRAEERPTEPPAVVFGQPAGLNGGALAGGGVRAGEELEPKS